MRQSYDAIVVGSGPNGLAAATALAQAGCSVLVFETNATVGGGARSAALTLPGFLHDVCSAVHPLALASPFFRTLPLAQHGLEWIHPPAPVAHPLDSGDCVLVDRALDITAARLGEDGARYRRLMKPLVADWASLERALLRPLRVPRQPLAVARFGFHAIRSARALAQARFTGERTRALFAGMAAHSILPLEKPGSAAFALILAITAHAVGWPIPRGGSQKIADALASYLRALGGEILTSSPVRSLDEVPPARVILCDVTPRQLLQMAGSRLPEGFRRKLARFRYGPGICKVDWALDGPIPWQAAQCCQAGTVHLGGSLDEIAASERAPWQGENPRRPFVLLAQPSLFDSTRAPQGRHVAWAYCHVPNGSNFDMVERIESQIERFAPGFGARVLGRSVLLPRDLEARNANLVGGDVGGGAQDLSQLFFRPTRRFYATPCRDLYLCSSSTPPGAGVHGMCGYFAAQAALRVLRGR
jgi:phytoene dehydrogenase-like protein